MSLFINSVPDIPVLDLVKQRRANPVRQTIENDLHCEKLNEFTY